MQGESDVEMEEEKQQVGKGPILAAEMSRRGSPLQVQRSALLLHLEQSGVRQDYLREPPKYGTPC